MPDSGAFDSPFHDTEVMALEEREREHAPRAFRVPRYTQTCPGCGRGVTAKMLTAPHWNPDAKPICTACLKRYAKWHRTPEQIEDSRRRRELQHERGEKAKGFVDG